MPVHNSMTDPYLHEPKGVAAADAGNVYVSDGAASGAWTPIWSGWGYYQDDGSDQVIGTTEAKLTNDGAGSLTTESYLPREIRGSDSLWDIVNDKILPVKLGDSYDLRFDLPITAESGNPTEMLLEFDIGGGASSSQVILSHYILTGKSTPYTITFTLPLVVLSSTTVDNGVQIFASTDVGTATISNPSITIVKTHDGDI